MVCRHHRQVNYRSNCRMEPMSYAGTPANEDDQVIFVRLIVLAYHLACQPGALNRSGSTGCSS